MKLNSFTYEEYEYILTSLATRYDLVDFNESHSRALKYESNYATIRHDVDLDLSLALSMAKIEYDLGISTTYLILVSSDAYNIFAKENKIILKNIISLGHSVGLHYNPLCYGVSAEAGSLVLEASLLESVLDEKIKVVSWHKPASLSSVNKMDVGYFDTTQPPFFNAQMKYFADSRGRWRYGHPLESPEFKARYPLHICFHPIWWSDNDDDNSKKLDDFVIRYNKNFKTFINNEISL